MDQDNATILVGDVGGTNVRLARVTVGPSGVEPFEVWKQPGDNFPNFEAALEAFLEESPGPADGVAMGVAGVMLAGRAKLLHSGWTIDPRMLRARMETKLVVLVNDFVAMARSAPDLPDDQLSIIRPGEKDPMGSVVVGGPGTGFGLGTLRRILSVSNPRDTDPEDGWVVVGGEGGHQAFAAQTELEWKLAQRLRQEGIYVSNEIIAAGAGFDITLRALGEVMGLRHEPMTPPQVIEHARMGDLLSLEFCRMRARCVMSALGDAALAANATGGVYVAGGVSGWLEPWLREPQALARFDVRGPRTELLCLIPIKLIAGDEAPLIGAAQLWWDRKVRGWL